MTHRPTRRLLCAFSLLLAAMAALTALGSPSAGRAEASVRGAAQGPGANPAVIDFVPIEGVIDPPVADYLLRQLDEAEADEADVVVIQLDTPGGLDVSMRDIVGRILSAKVPVVVWVSPAGARAASAGTFITMAAHVAVMAPDTTIGAAHPVNLGGEQDEVLAKKAAEDASALLRALAEDRGRNAEWANRAVRESAALNADEAVEQRVVDFTAGSPATLLRKLHGRTVTVDGRDVTISTLDDRGEDSYRLRFHKMSVIERLLHTAIRPEVAYFLLLIGLFGIIFEIYNPGIGAAGVLGGICLVVAFYSLSILPTSWAGVALLVLAVLFFVIDMHQAGLGVFTVGGMAALIGGSLMLFSGADPSLRLGFLSIGTAVAATLLFFISVMTAAIRARGTQPISGSEGMVGMYGEARTDIAPEGQVMAKGTLWKARTVGVAIPEGARVRIHGMSGLLLLVEEASQAEPADTGAGPE